MAQQTQAPPPPKGWDVKTQAQPAQVHHAGQVHNERPKLKGPLVPMPTPGVDMRSDTIEHT